MSAFLVNPHHVAALIRWYSRTRHILAADREAMANGPAKLATLLHVENARSVNARYPGEPLEQAHLFLPLEIERARRLEPVEVIKAVHCLVYQSCEHEDWETSEAKALLRRIEAAAMRALPGYDEADWEIEPQPARVPVRVLQ